MADPLDKLLAELNAKLDEVDSSRPASPSPTAKGDDLDNLLAAVRASSQQKSHIKAEQRQIQQQEALRRQERQQAENLAHWQAEANKWLRQVDPLSSEGLWFKDFARNYPSELEAAIAYLFPPSP
jgi:hypothetical protein